MKENGPIMISLLKSALILGSAFPSFAIGTSLKIPVVPYIGQPPHNLNKVHKRCKRAKKYWECIDRSQRKITTSQDMDY